VSPAPLAAAFAGPHVGEFLPPLLAAAAYLVLYQRRTRTLADRGHPVARWRVLAFTSGAVTAAAVQLPPFDTLADQVLIAHMIQHLIIGDICSLLIVLGLTGPVLQPLLHLRFTRPLRTLAHPVVALVLWAVNLYAWHLPLAYQLAIRVDLVHALEHACLLWFGTLLWLALIGPLPKPAWFAGWGELGYVVSVRFIGAVLCNVLIWAETVFYPVYRPSDAAHGLNPLADQNVAGGVMMIEQIVLTVILLGWLFLRFAARDDERQSLLDLARDRGVPLSDERAARAARAGAGPRLREQILHAAELAQKRSAVAEVDPPAHAGVPDDKEHP
jgi:cytochrome c oxidase assembly factor CtaG